MLKMLIDAGFKIDEVLPLYYEFTDDLYEKSLITKLAKIILPPTRYLFRVIK